MILNPILNNMDMVLLIGTVSCVILLLLILWEQIKGNRYRLKEKQLQEKKDAIPTRVPAEDMDCGEIRVIAKGLMFDEMERESDYKSTFIRPNKLSTRQCVYIDGQTHAIIARLIGALSDKDITVGGYIDNVLKAHLEEYRPEINELIRSMWEDILN